MSGSPWLLPEDGIVDEIAVEIAASGARRVALTWTERLLAAARILAAGHPVAEIERRLFISNAAAHALAAAVRCLASGTWTVPATPTSTPVEIAA